MADLRGGSTVGGQLILTTNQIPTSLPANGGTATNLSGGHAYLGEKSYINHTNSSYGQFQIGNPTFEGEASQAFISGSSTLGDSPTSKNGDDHVWCIGAGVYGIGGNTFGIGNKGYGGSVFSVSSSGVGKLTGKTIATTDQIPTSLPANGGNSTTVAGLAVATGRNNGANQIVRTNSSGYLDTGYINCSNGNEGNNANPARVWGTNGSDDYLRTYITSALSVNYANTAGSAPANGGTASYLSNFSVTGRSDADVNSYLTSGMFAFAGTPANAPLTYAAGITSRNEDVGLQIVGGYTTDTLCFRGWHSYGATFTPWRTVVHSGNIASQSVAYATTAGSAPANGGNATYAPNSSKLFSTDSSYQYGSAAPYYGYLSYNSTVGRWRFQVSPASPASVEVAYADSAGNVDTATNASAIYTATNDNNAKVTFNTTGPHWAGIIGNVYDGLSIGLYTNQDGASSHFISSKQIATTDQIPASFDSGHSFAANGWQKLSNGLILQWGNIQGYGIETAPLNIAFPNACLNAWATSYDGYGSSITEVSTTKLTGDFNSGTFDKHARWLAIGY